MSHISAIVCTSDINGFVLANGLSLGNCKDGSAVSIPWDGNTPLFISFTPEGGNYLATSLMFSNMSSLPTCDNVDMTLWTGIVEVHFKPKKSVLYPPPLLPYEMIKETITMNEIQHTVSLVDYCGVWLIIEDNETTKLCEYLSDKKSDINMDIVSNTPCLLHIRLSSYNWAVTYDDKKFVIHNMSKSTCTIKDNVLSFKSVNPLMPIITDFTADENKVNIKKYLDTNTHSAQKAAVNFLSNIIAGDIDKAYSLLSTTLKREFTKEQISDYIGKVHTIIENKYFTKSYDNSLAVLTKQSDNVNIANAYAFDVDSMNKINNITPL